jgi:Mlc titration factor MtfA (ptsG expression regulator)
MYLAITSIYLGSKGYEVGIDGQNVGLHELAHAQYYQTFIVEQQIDKKFRNFFEDFVQHGDKVHHIEKQNNKTLYSPYADKNFQEFWAESIEIFFEKPIALKTQYPDLYNALCFLLNQDPAIQQSSTLT